MKRRIRNCCFFILLLFPFSMTLKAQHRSTLKEELTSFIKTKKAEVGVAVVVNGRDTLTIHNERHFPMMSVYKLHQAIAVAHQLSKQHISFDTLLHVPEKSLRKDTYSPLREYYPSGDHSFSVKTLLMYTLLLSDNNACDILFDQLLEVKETNKFIRSIGIEGCSIVATEEEMQKQPQLCYDNYSTPLSAVQLLERLFVNPVLENEYRSFIIKTMLAAETGKERLPKIVKQKGGRIGHKTGTGGTNDKGEIIAVNDIGFVLLPDGQRYSIAVFVKDSRETLEGSERIIARISAMIYDFVTSKVTYQ